MIQLDCLKDCSGACCRQLPGGSVPWSPKEINKLIRIYGADLGAIEISEHRKRAHIEDVSMCRRLTDDGKCWFQVNNLHKPIACVNSVVPGDSYCLYARKDAGYDDGV